MLALTHSYHEVAQAGPEVSASLALYVPLLPLRPCWCQRSHFRRCGRGRMLQLAFWYTIYCRGARRMSRDSGTGGASVCVWGYV